MGNSALLNLLSGGARGFTEARRERRDRKSREQAQDKELKARESDREAQFAADENRTAAQLASDEATRKQRSSEFEAEMALKTTQEANDAKYKADMLASQDRENALNAQIQKLQIQLAKAQAPDNEGYDPYQAIGKAVSEVYVRNATGDDPTIAEATAARAATTLYSLYQTLGLIPTPIGPSYDEATGTAAQGQPGPNNPVTPGNEGIGFSIPGLFAIGKGQIKFGKSADELANQLRALK